MLGKVAHTQTPQEAAMSASASSNLRKSPRHVPRRGGSGMTTHPRRAAPKCHFSTLLSTLNCIKALNTGQGLCRATTEVDLDCSRQRCIASGFTGSISSSFLPFNLEYPRRLHKDCIGWILNRAA
jgi:hypothetical protein